MTRTFTPSRRRWLAWSGAAVAGGLWPTLGWSDGDGGGGNGPTLALAQTGLSGRIVVVGGGMAGATAAKYLRLWGGAGLSVTLVEPAAAYTSNIMSNLVLTGAYASSQLQFDHARLANAYGVVLRRASLVSLDAAAHVITLSDGGSLPYDRLVLAPGIAFDDAYGLSAADYESRTPHAWRAGPQTQLLHDQLAAMPAGGTFLMTIPKAPCRCPPGPYERACLVADLLKRTKGPNARVVVLDENPGIQAEKETFTHAFDVVHAGVIDYRPETAGIRIDPASGQVDYTDGAGQQATLVADVINPIVPHRAAGSEPGGWLAAAGLANGTNGRWAAVDVLSYESTAVPDVHVLGDAAQCGLPKAGHVANQEAKICADAIVRLLGGRRPDPAPVANSACYSPITAGTASWLTAVYQYDSASRSMKVSAGNGRTANAAPTEAASATARNYQQMGTWFSTLMADSFA